MTDKGPFPQRALLLGVTWFPATFLLLWVCSVLGWWSPQHMEWSLAVFFTALFLFAFLWQLKIVLSALVVFRAHPETRLPLNYLLFAVGVLTVVLAAGFTWVFGVITFND